MHKSGSFPTSNFHQSFDCQIMAKLARNLSAHIKRAMTGVGRTSLVSEISSNRSIIVFASIFEKSVTFDDVTKRLNDKLFCLYCNNANCLKILNNS